MRLDQKMRRFQRQVACSVLALVTVLGTFISFASIAPQVITSTKQEGVIPPSASEQYPFFWDDFEDQAINPAWTLEPNTGSITEPAGGYLRLYSAGSDWWGINARGVDVGCSAPYVYTSIPSTDFVMTTRNLNAGSVVGAQTGFILYVDEDNVVFFGVQEGYGPGSSVALEGISANAVWQEARVESSSNQYLRVRKEGNTYSFEYSGNGNTWTLLTSCTDALWGFTPASVGLYMKSYIGVYTEAQFKYFHIDAVMLQDEFDDQSIDPAWTQVPKTGSITELAGGYLRLYSPSCDWWGGSVICTAPYVYTSMPAGDFVITTRNLNTAGMIYGAHSGLMLYLDDDNVVFFGSYYGKGIALEGIRANTGWTNAKAGNYEDQYLRVRKLSGTYYFEYSADGTSWTFLTCYTDALWGFTPAKVGLFMKCLGGTYEAQFDYFHIDIPSTVEEDPIYGDEFDDQSIDAGWTQVSKTGSISELAHGYLQLYSTGCDWWGINNQGVDVGCSAPHVYMDMPATSFEFGTRNLNAGGSVDAHTGLMLYLDEDNVVFFGNYNGNCIKLEGISANVVWSLGTLASNQDQYLRVRKVSDTYYFECSMDGNSWVLLTSCTDTLWGFTPAKVGLFMKCWGGSYTAQFDYIHLIVNVPDWNEEFSDQSIDAAWMQEPKSGSISEPAGGYLRLSSPGCDWWGGSVGCTAPYVYTPLPAGDFAITTQNLNAAGIVAGGHVGLMLYLDEDNVIFFGSISAGRGTGIALEGITNNQGYLYPIAGDYLDQYLRVRKLSGTYYFEYSPDGITWALLNSCTDALWGFTPAKVGLFMKSWGGSYTAQFDYFHLIVNMPNWNDEFNDQSIDPIWTSVPKTGSVIELSGGYLQLYSTTSNWAGGSVVCTAPYICTTMPGTNFLTSSRNLNVGGMPSNSYVGLMLYSNEGDVVFFGNYRSSTRGDGIALEGISANVAWQDAIGGNFLAQFLRVRYEDEIYTFEYSANGRSWTTLKSCTAALWGFIPAKVGLFMKNSAGGSYSAQFDYFHLFDTSWYDEFDDQSIDPAWTLEPNTGSITEPAGGYLELYSTGCDWWFGSVGCTAPYVYTPLPAGDFVMTTLNLNAGGSVGAHAGLILYQDEDTVVFFGNYDGDSIRMEGIGDGALYGNVDNCQDPYLRVRKMSGTYYFEYSADGSTWTLLTSCAETIFLFTPAKVGLFMKNWAGIAYAAQFDYFHLNSYE